MVTEFLEYSVNNILYQRGIYEEEKFSSVAKYGLKLMLANDPALNTYTKQVLQQILEWLETGTVERIAMVVASIESGETMERWVFDIETDEEALKMGHSTKEKSEKMIQKEIAAILRQITSSVSYLPLIEVPCSFDILVYTKVDATVPSQWEESDAKYIKRANEVRLRSFDTTVHKLKASVMYQAMDEEEGFEGV